jgi:hypothetical protein
MSNQLIPVLRQGFATLLLAFALPAAPVAAATINFTLDPGASSVALTKTGSGLTCLLGTCSVDAAISMPSTGTSLGVGASTTFDFLTFTPSTLVGGTTNFDLSATLAFSDSTGAGTSVTGTGSGSAKVQGGLLASPSFSSGSLSWSTAPTNVTLSDGSVVQVSFQPVSAFSGSSVTAQATITGISTPSPVPLPAGGLLLVSALGGFALVRRRRRG